VDLLRLASGVTALCHQQANQGATQRGRAGGLSFCPLDSYRVIGGAGFLLGAAIGWVI
jgi:hypothetical protein